MKLHPLTCAVLALVAQLAHAADDGRRPYIVRLADKPVAGIKAVQPGGGLHLDLNAPDLQVYGAMLDQKRAAARALVANAPVSYEYKVVFNGFAARLTDDEVRQLKASAGVASVVADAPRHLLTSYTPSFLGLDAPGGLWSQLGGAEHAGEDIIVGIVDGGVWPEHPSYADRVDAQGAPTFDPSGTLAYGPPPAAWKGTCQTGEGYTAQHCNNKLIGAQFFDADFQTTGLNPHWSEFRSARDSLGGRVGHGGHGTHTSSTAAGNRGVASNVDGVPMGNISGMAPRARVAVYKVCWSYEDAREATGARASCFTGDSVAAIEQAVIDGVHVINYSISGGEQVDDPVELAFLHASNAGVFVAAAAGNAGPAASVNHVSPWLATIGAATHDRTLSATLTQANGVRYSGASLNLNALPSTAMIRAEDAGVAGADPSRVALCYSAASNNQVALLDPAKSAGKIVICSRGEIDRVEKSRAVLEAGGVGMVMVDNGGGPVADVHAVPTVHVTAADGALIQAYAQTSGAAGAISRFAATRGQVPAPLMAGFSSRGPSSFDPNLLKPDMAAPGVDILAGVTPGLTPEQRDQVQDGTLRPPVAWAYYQGTSMASPHVAGLAALLRQRHPGWSPAAIKSALMTTGSDTLPDTLGGMAAGALPWAQGAGHVTPNRADDPGLVYDATLADYRKYLCGLGLGDDCSGGSAAGYNLNLASITVSNVMGSQAVQRTVTNVGSKAATYVASAALTGYAVRIEPSTLTLGPGESKSFSVTLDRTSAPNNIWQYGHLVWSDGSHVVRSPLTARSGRAAVAPDLLQSEKTSGMKLLSVQTGFTGKMGYAVGGMQEVQRSALTLAQAAPGSADTLAQAIRSCQAGAPGVKVVPVAITANTMAARFETFDRDVEGGRDGQQDVDLLLLQNGAMIDYSMHVGANESISVSNPTPGNYQLCVIGYDLAQGAPAALTLSSTLVARSTLPGSLKVSLPSKVYANSTASVGLSWSGLASGKRYVGALQLFDPFGNLAATTVLSVNTDNAAPAMLGVTRATPRASSL
ncbi:MAG: S8 family serine peptidase [Sphingomonadaceae bacterium]